jgi:phosphatidylglycerophosphate synthase
MAEPDPPVSVETVGANPVRLWGLDTGERVRRIAAGEGLGGIGAPVVLANADHVFDPAWMRQVAERPGLVLTLAGRPVLAHARSELEAAGVRAAMREGAAVPEGMALAACEDEPEVENRFLKKRERPFALELAPDTRRAAERASFYGAYKGVTDALTRYLWPELALWLTRLAAAAGLSPNAVTTIGAAFCVAAAAAFGFGAYWWGMAFGFAFMVLDTVDGKLARCTLTSTWWGHLFDHGIDLVHPPLWYWFWATGLAHVGLGLSDALFRWTLGAILAGYVLQRLIEGIFIWRFGGLHIHVWRRFDSRFRLVTARRNPNMAILLVALLFGRPDIGIVAVAVWTAVSFAVHLIRLGQALQRRARGQAIASWLAAGDAA